MTTKITLRKKSISKNRLSLYLDYYPAVISKKTNQLTRREFLGFYLYQKPASQEEKDHNKEMITIAEQILTKRQVEYNRPEIYNEFEKAQLRKREIEGQDFLKYFMELVEKRKASNYDNWVSASHYLKEYTGGQLTFGELTEKFCNDYKYHILNVPSRKSPKTKLSTNSAHSYFNKFKAALKQAYKDGFLEQDINGKIDRIAEEETQRNFLTLEELNLLVKTDCQDNTLKRAALFSALTGLRYSDIKKLRWSEIEATSGNIHIHFKQKKTKGQEYHPITAQAHDLLGSRSSSEFVFPDLFYTNKTNRTIAEWVSNAGIEKKITFHCFRHTYACLLLENQVPIYTVSKMMGHRYVKTTEIYGKVMDKAKREAAETIQIQL